jgi:hypothetical protein
MRKSWSWLFVLLCLSIGCSRTPSKQKAAETVNDAFRDSKNYLIIRVGRIAWSCEDDDDGVKLTTPPTWSPAQNADIRIAQNVGYVASAPDGKGYWKISLTEKGQEVLNTENEKPYGRKTGNACDYEYVKFLIASPTLVEVTEVAVTERVAVVQYAYKWAPTELGLALRKGGEAYSKLTSLERTELQYHLEKASMLHGVNIPVPPNDDVSYGSIMLAKGDDGWQWVPVRKF